MDSASRHAQRLADNFINDIDTMARNSRLADRRAMSHFETTPRMEERAPSVLRTVRYSPAPYSRLGSVQPAPIGSYRSSSVLTGHLPPRYPSRPASVLHTCSTSTHSNCDVPIHHYSSTVRRIHGSPSCHHSVADGYLTPRASNYGRVPYYGRTPVMSSSISDLSSERRRLDRRLNDLLEYKLPSADYYLNMKGSLRNLNDKMLQHKQLLDRYSGIDMYGDTDSVSDRVDRKFHELVLRMPEIEGFRSRGPSNNTSRSETDLYYRSPKTTLGYGQGLTTPTGGATSELRGRIKRLLCRSKKDPHYYRYRPNDL